MVQAASVIYYTSVEQKYIFKRFVQGKIIERNSVFETQYMVSWSFYDITLNRPFVCFMYFDLYKESLENYKEQIYEVLEKVADRNMSLDMMAYAIDKKLPNLWPQKLRKIDLGPLHNVFAKDELDVTHSLLKAIFEKTLDLTAYAMSFSIEEVESKGNFAEGGLFNKKYVQVWENSTSQKYLFTSHRVMQVLYDTIPETINGLTKEPIEIPALKL